MPDFPNGVHPNLGQNWHARMTELAMAMHTGECRSQDILTNDTAQAEAEWLLEEVLFKDDNHEVLKYNDEGFHPKWQYTKLIPSNLDDETQDRWIDFMEKAITHFQTLGIPTNQYGNTPEAGDDYEQALEKLELKFDPSKAKQPSTVKNELQELKELVMAMTQVQLAQTQGSD